MLSDFLDFQCGRQFEHYCISCLFYSSRKNIFCRSAREYFIKCLHNLRLFAKEVSSTKHRRPMDAVTSICIFVVKWREQRANNPAVFRTTPGNSVLLTTRNWNAENCARAHRAISLWTCRKYDFNEHVGAPGRREGSRGSWKSPVLSPNPSVGYVAYRRDVTCVRRASAKKVPTLCARMCAKRQLKTSSPSTVLCIYSVLLFHWSRWTVTRCAYCLAT